MKCSLTSNDEALRPIEEGMFLNHLQANLNHSEFMTRYIPMAASASNPTMINAKKHPLIARQVIMAKQLPLTTLPITDWQQAAQDPAATPTGLNPNMQQEMPKSNTNELRAKASITANSIIIKYNFFSYILNLKSDKI